MANRVLRRENRGSRTGDSGQGEHPGCRTLLSRDGADGGQREKNRGSDENWIRDLKPEEVELIGDILKQYLA